MTRAFEEYLSAGWALCAIPAGSKGPHTKGWNRPEHAITSPQQLNGAVGVGLLHAVSGTGALDIDNLPEARAFLASRGIDLDALLGAPDAVQISSGRPGRAKLLYRMPAPLLTRKLGRYENLIDGKRYHALELRCAARDGASVQDCLPGTIHPETQKPYEWRYGDDLIGSWRQLPDIPPKLLALWQECAQAEPAEDLIGTSPAAEQEPAGASIAELRHYLSHIDPDSSYDDWVAVGMALHDATGGSPEGLILWDEWSRRGKKYGESHGGLPPQYPTEKWPSFTAGHGFTIGYLKSKAPPYVAPDAFPLVPVEEEFKPSTGAKAEPDRGTDTRPGAIIRRALAPLVFVSSQGTYFDTDRRVLLNRDAIDDLYTPLMPIVHITGNNGSVKTHQPKPRDELRRASWKEVVHAIGMHPGMGKFFEENGQRFLNTYEATKIEPLQPTAAEREAFEFMWSRPDEAVFRDWLMKFYAHAVQKPGVKITTAPLLVGHATGSGKNTLMKVLPELLFTPRYMTVMTNQLLQGQFSDQLANAWWVHFEELHSGNAKSERIAVANRVKSWITDNTIVIRPMYGKAYDAPNRIQITAASNYEDDAIDIDGADRRWVLGHIQHSMSDRESADLYAFLESPRAPGVLHHIFREVSLTDFNPRGRAPETNAKKVMVQVNYGHWESTLLEMIGARSSPFDKDLLEAKDILPFVKQGGVTAARLGRIMARPPFNFVQYPVAYGNRLWCWRNADIWNNISFKDRQDYYAGLIERPHGWPWKDQLPPELAEACGLPLTPGELLL